MENEERIGNRSPEDCFQYLLSHLLIKICLSSLQQEQKKLAANQQNYKAKVTIRTKFDFAVQLTFRYLECPHKSSELALQFD